MEFESTWEVYRFMFFAFVGFFVFLLLVALGVILPIIHGKRVLDWNENFLTKAFRGYWKTFLFVAVLFFAFFVWPTPYRTLPYWEGCPARVNRLTGAFQYWYDGTWNSK